MLLRSLVSDLQFLECSEIWPFLLQLGSSDSSLAGAVFDRRTVAALVLSLDSFVNDNGLPKGQIRQQGGKVQFGSVGELEVDGTVQEVVALLRRVWENVNVFPERVERLKKLCKALIRDENKCVVKNIAVQSELAQKHHLRAAVIYLALLIGREAARRGNDEEGWHSVSNQFIRNRSGAKEFTYGDGEQAILFKGGFDDGEVEKGEHRVNERAKEYVVGAMAIVREAFHRSGACSSPVSANEVGSFLARCSDRPADYHKLLRVVKELQTLPTVQAALPRRAALPAHSQSAVHSAAQQGVCGRARHGSLARVLQRARAHGGRG